MAVRLHSTLRRYRSFLVLFLSITAASSVSAADNESDPRLTLTIVTEHERSAATLLWDEQPVCVLYGQGSLSGDLVRDDHRKDWDGHVTHLSDHGERHRYTIRWSERSRELISINGRLFRIPVGPALETEGETRTPWFVLTSYGRPIASGRYFSVPTGDDLDPKSQYSHAWYFDMDAYAAESQRNTLAMDDLKGWVIAWDEQHCIQHSDGARVAKLRVFGDGRVVVNETHNGPLVEKRISIDRVRKLREDLLRMGKSEAVSTSPLEQVVIAQDAVDLFVGSMFPSTLQNFSMWDQYQDVVCVQTGQQTEEIRIVHPGPDGGASRVPAGWESMRDRLNAIAHGRGE